MIEFQDWCDQCKTYITFTRDPVICPDHYCCSSCWAPLKSSHQ